MYNSRFFAKKNRGFSLIELMVVIGIIGVLSTIVMVSLSSAREKGRDARRIADIRNIQLALSLYYQDHYFYPKNIYASSNAYVGSDSRNGLLGTYFPVVPTDPNSSVACSAGTEASCYKYAAFSATGGACLTPTTRPTKYHLAAVLEDRTNGELSRDVDAPLAGSGSMAGLTYCTGSGSGDFHGLSTTCGGSTSSPDGCYDQTP